MNSQNSTPELEKSPDSCLLSLVFFLSLPPALPNRHPLINPLLCQSVHQIAIIAQAMITPTQILLLLLLLTPNPRKPPPNLIPGFHYLNQIIHLLPQEEFFSLPQDLMSGCPVLLLLLILLPLGE